METIKEILLMQIESTSDWRMQKAHEYPEDAQRNETASQALNNLFRYIESLPDDHELFVLQELLYEYLDDLEENTVDPAYELNEELNSNIGTYGFQDKSTPKEWVQEQISTMKTIMRP